MKKLVRVLGLAVLLTLGACGGGGGNPSGGNSPTGATKPINSTWTLEEANYANAPIGFTLDLRRITVGNTHSLNYSNGCKTNVSFAGNLYGGIYAQNFISGCGELNGEGVTGAFAINGSNKLQIVVTHANGDLLSSTLEEQYR